MFRDQFDEISMALQRDIASMHQELWYPDRAHEADVYGLHSKQAKRALMVVAIVLGVLLFVFMVLELLHLGYR